MEIKVKVNREGEISTEFANDDCSVIADFYRNLIIFDDFIYDEENKICGIKGKADCGHGYGFKNGWKEFTLMMGGSYTFTYEYTSINGPSDWEDESCPVTLIFEKTE